MSRCFCSYTPQSTSVAKFISSQPWLKMLENQCTTMKDLQIIHAQLIKTGLFKDKIAASRVLSFCASTPAPAASCPGDYNTNYAYLVFTQIENPNLFIWNTIIRCFSQSSNPEFAISLFLDLLVRSKLPPGRLTYPSVFKAYTRLGLAENGAQLHGRIIKEGLEFDQFTRNAILYMYASCSGYLNDARKLFDEESEVFDVVAWNSMILGLAKFGEIDDSRKLFDKMPLRNHVSWNTMISGYVRNGKSEEAFDVFNEMQEQGIKPSEHTLVSLLNASAQLGALEQGKWVHDYIRNNNSRIYESNPIVVTAIINMYCKCGDIEMASQVFNNSKMKSLSCWNSLISGLANNGFCREAIQLFSRLENSNLKPDSVSFLAVLTACCNRGLLKEAEDYFKSMKEVYKIEASVEHYGCLIDALGRKGFLEEAKEVIMECMAIVEIEPDVAIWGSLLRASRQHGNMKMAKWAADRLNHLDPNDSCSYLEVLNMYAESGHFRKAIRERVLMKEKEIVKQPGCSSIVVDGKVHEFLASGNGFLQFHVSECIL